MAPQPEQSTDEQIVVDVRGSIMMMETVLSEMLVPTLALTPEQLQDAGAMFLTMMHLRKVTPEFWISHVEAPMSLFATATQLAAECRLYGVEGLSPEAKETCTKAGELSYIEIAKYRATMMKTLNVLKEMPYPGSVTLH